MALVLLNPPVFSCFLVPQTTPPPPLPPVLSSETDDVGELACEFWLKTNSRIPIAERDSVLAARLSEEVCEGFVKQARKGRLQLDRLRLVRWLPPPYGAVKVNTDGALKYHNGHGSVGGLIRDCFGRWIRGFARNLGHQATDILTIELMGVREGLQLLIALNLRNAVVEMDCEVAVNLLKNSVHHEAYPKAEDSLQSTVLNDCVGLIKQMNGVECRHTLREGNSCADFLANLGQSTQEGATAVFVTPMPEIDHLLWADRVGVTYLRTH